MKSTNTTIAAAAPESSERLAYTKAELGAKLSLSPVSIYRLEQRGLLRPIPGIRHKLFSVAEVNRFLAGGGRAR
jgi:hypothetical protein